MRGFLSCLLAVFILLGCTQTTTETNETLNETLNHSNDSVETTPEIQVCVDTDGIDEFTLGNVIINETGHLDSCVGGLVIEYYCEGDELAIKNIKCPIGYKCDSGKCVFQEEQEEPVEEEEANCLETDDGPDYLVYGSVNYEGQIYHDFCKGTFSLQEYYCQDDEMKQKTYYCETGDKCVEGACVPLQRSCSDSDESSPEEKGTTIQYDAGTVVESRTDYCLDDDTKVEYFCSNSVMKSENLKCPELHECSDGACMSLCQDSDGGKAYSVVGSVTVGFETYDDFCKDDETIIEYSCSGNELMLSEKECGLFCADGRCLLESELGCSEDGSQISLLSGITVLKKFNDKCISYNTGLDYVCIDGSITYITNNCRDFEVCETGNCIRIDGEKCYDADEGDDAITTPSTTARSDNRTIVETKDDYCLNSGTIVEYGCSDANITETEFQCPAGYSCSYGACRPTD